MKQDDYVKRSDDLVWRKIDEQILVLSPKDSQMYSFLGVGSRVWELLDQTSTLRDIVDALTDEYKVEEDQCHSDIIEFIKDLEKKDLVNISPQG